MTSLAFSLLRVLLWLPLFLSFVVMILMGFVLYCLECVFMLAGEGTGKVNGWLETADQALAHLDDAIKERSGYKDTMAQRIRELESELEFCKESERAAWKHAHQLEGECLHGDGRCVCGKA